MLVFYYHWIAECPPRPFNSLWRQRLRPCGNNCQYGNRERVVIIADLWQYGLGNSWNNFKAVFLKAENHYGTTIRYLFIEGNEVTRIIDVFVNLVFVR